MKKVRARFAPSPTGNLHIGNLRSVLYGYLLAKSKQGDFILRIEDTDQTRYVEGSIDMMLEGFDWLGVRFDEGPREGGEFSPYIQSERLEIYKKYADELINKGWAYYCFCSQDELKEERIKGDQLMYSGKCRALDVEESKKRVTNGEKAVIRLKVPKGREVVVNDVVYGDVKFDTNFIDDQVLMKSDGFPTYHLAVVVDDHLMEISHVTRSNEWLPSSGKHVLLYEAFGWELPTFVHLSPVLADDGKKLSKRKGALPLIEYKKLGYLPQAVINYIVLTGWNAGDNVEVMSWEEMLDKFDVSRLQKKGSTYNVEKLNWYNKIYLSNLSADELLSRYLEIGSNWNVLNLDKEHLKKIIEVERSRIITIKDLDEMGKYYFEEPELEVEKIVFKKSTKEITLDALHLVLKGIDNWEKWDKPEDLFEFLKSIVNGNDHFSNGDVFWPVRYALSGADQSPSPNELMWVLGREKSGMRIKQAIELLS